MPKQTNTDDEDVISVKEMKSALEVDIREVMKAAHLRIAELAHITTEYAAGRLSPEIATDKYMHYADKWGDALPGVNRATVNVSDEQIIADMEKGRRTHTDRLKARSAETKHDRSS